VRAADGAKLNGVEHSKSAFCGGYLAGYLDSLAVSIFAGAKQNICLPKDGLAGGQAARVIVKWLKENPEKLHENGRVLIYAALVFKPVNYGT
jgi:hypothetical protein